MTRIEGFQNQGNLPIEQLLNQNVASSQTSLFANNSISSLLGIGGMPSIAGGFSPFNFSTIPLMNLLASFFSSFGGIFGGGTQPNSPWISLMYGVFNPPSGGGGTTPVIIAQYGVFQPGGGSINPPGGDIPGGQLMYGTFIPGGGGAVEPPIVARYGVMEPQQKPGYTPEFNALIEKTKTKLAQEINVSATEINLINVKDVTKNAGITCMYAPPTYELTFEVNGKLYQKTVWGPKNIYSSTATTPPTGAIVARYGVFRSE